MRVLILLLLYVLAYGGDLQLSGVCSVKLSTHQREGEEFISTASLASAMDGVRFFVPEKAKEVLKLWGHEMVFTYANPYAILDGDSYRLKSSPRLEGALFLIAVEDFVCLLKQIREFDVVYNDDELTITPATSNQPVVIVLDPGHGGKDPGAIGLQKTQEKDIVLDVSKRAKELLEQEGVKVILTRDDDIFIPLAERAKIANKQGAKLFVSIHCNAHRSRKYSGTETFFLSPAKDSQARNTAALENASLLMEKDPPVKDLSEIEGIIADMLHSEYIKESYHLAGYIQEQLGNRLNRNNRGINQAGFYVLAGAFMPSVLVEIAFISNPSEEKLLKTASFRQKAAQSIADGVMEFLRVQGLVKK